VEEIICIDKAIPGSKLFGTKDMCLRVKERLIRDREEKEAKLQKELLFIGGIVL
jgi:hypothetical protein